MAYVFELLKVLRKPEYDNQPIAQGFVAELESFNTMPSGMFYLREYAHFQLFDDAL